MPKWSCAFRSCGKGTYFSGFLEPRRLAKWVLTAVGISTHSVDDLVKAMGMIGISKSQVSRLCEEIEERVKAPSIARSKAHAGGRSL